MAPSRKNRTRGGATPKPTNEDDTVNALPTSRPRGRTANRTPPNDVPIMRSRAPSRKRKQNQLMEDSSGDEMEMEQMSNKRRSKKQRDNSGELSDLDNSTNEESSESEYENDLPVTSFGCKTGDNISKKMVKKIRNDEFVEFQDLLPNFTKNSDFCLTLDEENNAKFVRKNQRENLRFTQWSEAFDIFSVIYVETHPQFGNDKSVKLMKELMTYRGTIRNIMKQGGNWQSYDKHFRFDLQNKRFKWSTIRYDLILMYTSSPSQKPNAGMSGQSTHMQKQPGKPTRYCYTFNSRFKTCHNGYSCALGKHLCMKCDGNHPSFACNHAGNHVSRASTYNAGRRDRYNESKGQRFESKKHDYNSNWASFDYNNQARVNNASGQYPPSSADNPMVKK